ncbi:DNA-processing protein DprA [Portibacter marinus]|uniref:DNA-processing protein DprA n=1 Tax=Portibacter marinus TaxID=2898660 RepID=UPI001F283912|nr:DNA-processing protein DprA [Portibacter marinus]
MNLEEKDIYKVALSMTQHVGSRRAKQLIHHFGSAEAVFQASKKEIRNVPGISQGIAQALADPSLINSAKSELEFIRKNKIELLYFMDDAYPARLKPYDDAPVCLFYKGSVSLNSRKHVSIIGTRKPTDRGKWICEKLVKDLREYDITVVSGLAYGVDIVAHKASLEAGLPTIGVVAHGLDTIYPSAHRSTAKNMVTNGGILTEFVRNTKPGRDRFPARNRIIAGISDALIVIESKESGGSMITANFANDYNKDVFAVPGRIDDPASQGCNLLIKQHKAFLLDSAEELVKMMRWEKQETSSVQRSLFANLKREELKVVEGIRMGVDDVNGICNYMSMAPSEVSAILLNLEMEGFIRSVPGNRYMVLD